MLSPEKLLKYVVLYFRVPAVLQLAPLSPLAPKPGAGLQSHCLAPPLVFLNIFPSKSSMSKVCPELVTPDFSLATLPSHSVSRPELQDVGYRATLPPQLFMPKRHTTPSLHNSHSHLFPTPPQPF